MCVVFSLERFRQKVSPHFLCQGWPASTFDDITSFGASIALTSKAMVYVTMLEPFLCFKCAPNTPEREYPI